MDNIRKTKARDIFARILAAENVQIVYSSDAKTASYNPRKRIIELPTSYLTAAQTSAADMFLLHEAMHAMETPKNMLSRARKMGAGFPDVCNLIEDVRIDRCGIALYPAARKLNAAGIRELNTAGFFGSKLSAPDADDLMANLFAYRLTAAGYEMPYNLPADIKAALDRMSKPADVYDIAKMIMSRIAPASKAATQAAADAAKAAAQAAAVSAAADADAAEAAADAAGKAGNIIDKTEAAREAQAAANDAAIAAAEAAKAAEAAQAAADADADNTTAANIAAAAATQAAADADKAGIAARKARGIAQAADVDMSSSEADKIRAAAEAAAGCGSMYSEVRADDAVAALGRGDIEEAAIQAHKSILGEISLGMDDTSEKLKDIAARQIEATQTQRIAAADKLAAAAVQMTAAAADGTTAAFIPYAAAEAAYMISAKRAAHLVFGPDKPRPEMTRAGRPYEAPEAHFAADISAMVTEFNRRKAAHTAAMTSRKTSGRVDARRLARYKVTDSIFKRLAIQPAGKNHAVVLLLDMSGSMSSSTLAAAADTMQIIAGFCRRENIAAEYYGYTTFNRHDWMHDAAGSRAGKRAIYAGITTADKAARCTSDDSDVLHQFADSTTATAMLAAMRAYYRGIACNSVGYITSRGCTPTVGAYSHLPMIISRLRAAGNENITVIDITDGCASDGLSIPGRKPITAISYAGITRPCAGSYQYPDTIAALIAEAHDITFARIYIETSGGDDFIEKRDDSVYSHDLVYYPAAATSGDAISEMRGRRVFAQTIGRIIGDAAFGGV